MSTGIIARRFDEDRREARRLAFNSTGSGLVHGATVRFRTIDVSLGGCCISFEGRYSPPVGSSVSIELPALGFGAEATVCWAHLCDSTLRFGLKFDRLRFRTG